MSGHFNNLSVNFNFSSSNHFLPIFFCLGFVFIISGVLNDDWHSVDFFYFSLFRGLIGLRCFFLCQRRILASKLVFRIQYFYYFGSWCSSAFPISLQFFDRFLYLGLLTFCFRLNFNLFLLLLFLNFLLFISLLILIPYSMSNNLDSFSHN